MLLITMTDDGHMVASAKIVDQPADPPEPATPASRAPLTNRQIANRIMRHLRKARLDAEALGAYEVADELRRVRVQAAALRNCYPRPDEA